ncbi:hypothetical protein KAR91_28505 [Candidatus Pacearchaeota archaeon]|nr:hypothetical protein [Candidatus Pacearchaeota archaeon]
MNKFKIGTEKLSRIVRIVNALVDEVRVKIDKKGWKITCVDPAHVAMLDMDVDKKVFDKYDFKDKLEIGVDVDKLKDILTLCEKHGIETFEGEIMEGKVTGTHDILVTVGNLKRLLVGVNVEGMSNPKIPNYPNDGQPVEREVKVEDLVFGMKNAELISDHIAFIADDFGLKLRADGDMDHVDMLLNDNGHKESQRSQFSLDYLGTIIEVAPVDKINLRLGTDYPVDIVYDFEGVKVRYLLAPRVEAE